MRLLLFLVLSSTLEEGVGQAEMDHVSDKKEGSSHLSNRAF